MRNFCLFGEVGGLGFIFCVCEVEEKLLKSYKLRVAKKNYPDPIFSSFFLFSLGDGNKNISLVTCTNVRLGNLINVLKGNSCLVV